MIRFGSLKRDYSLSKGSLQSHTISASIYNVIAMRWFQDLENSLQTSSP